MNTETRERKKKIEHSKTRHTKNRFFSSFLLLFRETDITNRDFIRDEQQKDDLLNKTVLYIVWDKVLCEKSQKENMFGGHLLVAQSNRALRRFRLDEANNSKTHACDSISIQQSAREHWNGAMNTQRIKHYCWPLFSCENALFARIFRLNPIFLTYDEQQQWIRWIRHTHTFEAMTQH